jgi:hypothetical protein
MEVWYEGVRVGRFRADFVVAKRVIVEVKATEYLTMQITSKRSTISAVQ